MNTAIDQVKQNIEDILSFFGINIEAEVWQDEEGFVQVKVPSSDESSLLIGRGGETMRSLQTILTAMLHGQGFDERVNLDVAGYKEQRAEKMTEKAHGWIKEVRETGDSRVEKLGAADRRIVHKVAQEYDDIETFSEGFGRDRKIVIAQKTS